MSRYDVFFGYTYNDFTTSSGLQGVKIVSNCYQTMKKCEFANFPNRSCVIM